jgi:signal transduction histidine kinase/DNA-binding XRE family transcriptional regulator
LQDAVRPFGSAQLVARVLRRQARWLNRVLGRTERSFQALRWLGLAIQAPDQASVHRVPCDVALAFEAVRRTSDPLAIDIVLGSAVLAAPGVLETVMSHLLTNARRYAAGAWVTVRARIGKSEEAAVPLPQLAGAIVLLTIADDGPGIAPAQAAQLFEPHSERMDGGMGSGLWLSRLLVRATGGDLWLDDVPRGASFTSAWPLALPVPSQRWPTDPVEFGLAVRRTREAAGLTRAQLSQRALIADSTIRNVETGRHRPTAQKRNALIAALPLP